MHKLFALQYKAMSFLWQWLMLDCLLRTDK